MKCSNCSCLNDDNSRFCMQCGQPLRPENNLPESEAQSAVYDFQPNRANTQVFNSKQRTMPVFNSDKKTTPVFRPGQATAENFSRGMPPAGPQPIPQGGAQPMQPAGPQPMPPGGPQPMQSGGPQPMLQAGPQPMPQPNFMQAQPNFMQAPQTAMPTSPAVPQPQAMPQPQMYNAPVMNDQNYAPSFEKQKNSAAKKKKSGQKTLIIVFAVALLLLTIAGLSVKLFKKGKPESAGAFDSQAKKQPATQVIINDAGTSSLLYGVKKNPGALAFRGSWQGKFSCDYFADDDAEISSLQDDWLEEGEIEANLEVEQSTAQLILPSRTIDFDCESGGDSLFLTADLGDEKISFLLEKREPLNDEDPKIRLYGQGVYANQSESRNCILELYQPATAGNEKRDRPSGDAASTAGLAGDDLIEFLSHGRWVFAEFNMPDEEVNNAYIFDEKGALQVEFWQRTKSSKTVEDIGSSGWVMMNSIEGSYMPGPEPDTLSVTLQGFESIYKLEIADENTLLLDVEEPNPIKMLRIPLKKPTLLIILLIILCVAIIGTAIYLITKKKSPAKAANGEKGGPHA